MDVQEHAERELITGLPGPDPRVRAGKASASTTVAGSSPATEVSGVIGEQQWRAITDRLLNNANLKAKKGADRIG